MRKLTKIFKGILIIGLGVMLKWVILSTSFYRINTNDYFHGTKTILMIALILIGILEIKEAIYD